MNFSGWRVGAPDIGWSVFAPEKLVWNVDVAVSLAILAAAWLGCSQHQRGVKRAMLRERLARMEVALALIDRATALSFEIEDRYGRRDGAADHDIPAILDLRRSMAMTMADARAALEAYGDLRDQILPEDAFLIAVRPVVERPATLGADERSLERLRGMLVRLRFEAGDVAANLRKRLGYRAHGVKAH